MRWFTRRLPAVTAIINHMELLINLKLCRKGLHQYAPNGKGCAECHKNIKKKWRKNNKEKLKKHNQKYYEENKETLCNMNKKWKEEHNEQHRATCTAWHKNNPGRSRALYAKQRAAKKQAIAPWANMNEIKKIYEQSVELTKKTGNLHHVDHIYPLQNKYMCGLHVETNLQILTAHENMAKGNRVWPGQLDCQKK